MGATTIIHERPSQSISTHAPKCILRVERSQRETMGSFVSELTFRLQPVVQVTTKLMTALLERLTRAI